MKVSLIAHTPNPEKVVAAAAKMCYASADVDTIMDNLTEEGIQKFINMLVELGHESPFEHATFTFAIEGVSRALLAQITRHRMASFSVQSQRYVAEDNFDYLLPRAVMDDSQVSEIFHKSMQEAQNSYNEIVSILKEKYYNLFLKGGFSEKEAKNKAQKKAIENARYVLPNACDTKMVVTFNARSLMNFFKLRCCNRAQEEIRCLAYQMLFLVKEVAPNLFKNAGAPCKSGKCPEGNMSCKKG